MLVDAMQCVQQNVKIKHTKKIGDKIVTNQKVIAKELTNQNWAFNTAVTT
jgi:hypothetical protein